MKVKRAGGWNLGCRQWEEVYCQIKETIHLERAATVSAAATGIMMIAPPLFNPALLPISQP